MLEELRGQVSCLASGRGAVKGSPELLAPQILELFLPFNLHSRLPPSHCLQPFGGRAKHCLGISARINLLWLYLHLSVFVSHLNSDIYWHKCAMESQFGEKRQYLLWRTTRPQLKNILTNFKYMDVSHWLCWMKPDAGNRSNTMSFHWPIKTNWSLLSLS